jgi:hypothetical protein
MGDYAHAARMFVDDDMRLAPKLKFQYHVSFSINSQALKSLNFKYQHQNEINMLVKTAELPKFQIATETLNQYNRKKVVQTKIDYQPVNIVFHEDNFGVVRQLWENYYGYYYADAEASKIYGNYNRTAMLGPGFIRTPYGLDNNSSIPFFNNITIYQFGRRQFTSATLVNPVISQWSHDTLNYSDSGPAQNTMTLAYEAVNYGSGSVSPNNPPGFGVDHYDTTPSPLSLGGGGTATEDTHRPDSCASSVPSGWDANTSFAATKVERVGHPIVAISSSASVDVQVVRGVGLVEPQRQISTRHGVAPSGFVFHRKPFPVRILGPIAGEP